MGWRHGPLNESSWRACIEVDSWAESKTSLGGSLQSGSVTSYGRERKFVSWGEKTLRGTEAVKQRFALISDVPSDGGSRYYRRRIAYGECRTIHWVVGIYGSTINRSTGKFKPIGSAAAGVCLSPLQKNHTYKSARNQRYRLPPAGVPSL